VYLSAVALPGRTAAVGAAAAGASWTYRHVKRKVSHALRGSLVDIEERRRRGRGDIPIVKLCVGVRR